MITLFDQALTRALDELNQYHQNDHGDQHDGRVKALVAVANTHITETTTTDGTGHGGVVHQRDQGDDDAVEDRAGPLAAAPWQ